MCIYMCIYIYTYLIIFTCLYSWNANRLSSLRTLAFLDEDLLLIFRTVSWSHRPHISSVAKTRLSLPLSLKARLVCSEILKSPQSAWETSSGNQIVFCAAGYQQEIIGFQKELQDVDRSCSSRLGLRFQNVDSCALRPRDLSLPEKTADSNRDTQHFHRL